MCIRDSIEPGPDRHVVPARRDVARDDDGHLVAGQRRFRADTRKVGVPDEGPEALGEIDLLKQHPRSTPVRAVCFPLVLNA